MAQRHDDDPGPAGDWRETARHDDWSFIAAISFIYMLPPILVIYLFQKYLLVGMTFGTVRGEV